MFRYGGEFTRSTRDMDTARVMGLADYKQKLEDALKVGWNGFTGVLSDVPPPKPKDVPEMSEMWYTFRCKKIRVMAAMKDKRGD